MKIKILFFVFFVIILSSCTNNVVPDDKVKITVENKVKDIELAMAECPYDNADEVEPVVTEID